MDTLKSWNAEKGPNFVNFPNFVTIFCQVLKITIIFFDIPSNPPPIVVQNSLTNKFYRKKLLFCIFSKNKKKVTSLNRDIHAGDSWPYENILISPIMYWILICILKNPAYRWHWISWLMLIVSPLPRREKKNQLGKLIFSFFLF